jgi:hypothetical protein
MRLKFV